MSELKTISIKDGLVQIIDYRGKTPPKSESGITLISAANIKSGTLDFSRREYISSEDYQNWTTRGFAKPGDILFTTEAPTGEVALYPEEGLYQISRRVIALRTDEEKLHNYYLFYALQSPQIKNRLLQANRGSTVPRLLKTDITDFKFQLPNYAKQKEIAAVLACLDAKIENLERQNETLERIAQTLFKHWFIDFEFPNENGEPYRSSGGAMQPSELGEIPAGWRVGKLGELMILNYGKTLLKQARNGGDYLVVGSSGVIDKHNTFLVKAPGIVIGRKGTIGAVTWLDENFYPIDTTFYITDNLEVDGLIFHYFVLKNQKLDRLMSDSAVPGLNRNMACSVEILIPKLTLISRFNSLIDFFFNKKASNTQQIQTLTTTRDTLLPQLMSGKLRVTE